MVRQNITYASRSKNKNLLDIIYEERGSGRPVIFFIHGGSWMTGSKDMYTKPGENFLSRGFVSVIISYRLFPVTDVFGMAADCKDALNWCKENIALFGGDAKRIYMMGHSAGGHLAAVAGLQEKNPSDHISGFILIDAFGLCAFHFLTEHGMLVPEFLADIFGKEKHRWANVSPEKLLREDLPPFLILTGANTYPFLSFDNLNFVRHLKENKIPHEHKVILSKSHMQMIFQFENRDAGIYKDVVEWISRNVV